MQVALENKATGEKTSVEVGWSWIIFVFWPIGLPLFRRNLPQLGAVAIGLFLSGVISTMTFLDHDYDLLTILDAYLIAAGAWHVAYGGIFAAKANELQAKRLLENGWNFVESDSLATVYAKRQWALPT